MRVFTFIEWKKDRHYKGDTTPYEGGLPVSVADPDDFCLDPDPNFQIG
jgi:hypothetical protein